ncbi:hypothetical protein UT300010_08210 [Clostridium perfringens]
MKILNLYNYKFLIVLTNYLNITIYDIRNYLSSYKFYFYMKFNLFYIIILKFNNNKLIKISK